MAGETSTEDYFGMSDDDFLKINSPPTPAESDVGQQETAGATTTTTEAGTSIEQGEQHAETASEGAESTTTTDPTTSTAAAAVEEDGGPTTDRVEATKVTGADKDRGSDASTGSKDTSAADGDNKDASKTEAAADTSTETKVDFEGFFKKVMAPFKANGREIKLESPEEAIRLMQMGAGYGRKLQDLQPALKTLRMLEKNDLLDEGRLSFLIDINNKKPEAIKKLIAESGIDPLELNIGDNVTYTPTNHSVSDKEMALHSVLNDVQSTEAGQETIRVVNQTWDQESKSVLWESPELLNVINAQRENGVYDRITAEVERQKLLGQIPPTTPFLQAYKLAGDHLSKQATQSSSGSTTSQQPQVVAVRTAAPKAQVQNGEKAAAAASTKTVSQRSAHATVNPLEMADDDFLKTFKGRL